MATATGTAPRTTAAGPPGSPAVLLLRGGGLAHGVENISEDLPGALREERHGEKKGQPGRGGREKISLRNWQVQTECVWSVRHRRRRCRRPRRHTGSACWGPTELLSFQLFF